MIDNKTKNQLLNELENLTKVMDIPFQRQRDPHWLLRNAGINNPDHKNLNKIFKICKYLISEEHYG